MTALPQPTPQIEQPFFDKKTGTIALLSVLVLHGFVAVGLANMTIPEIKPPKVTPPLEILFIKSPPPVEVKPEDIKSEPEPKPIEKSVEKLTQPKSKPVSAPTPKTVTPTVTTPIPKTVTPTVTTPTPKTVTPTVTTPIPKTVTPTVTTPTPKTVTPPTTTPIPKTVTPPATTPIPKTVTPPTSKTTVGTADWISKPDMSIPANQVEGIAKGTKLTISIALVVDPNGRIISATQVGSTGKQNIDRIALQRVRQGKFNKSTVTRKATLPFSIYVV